MPKLLQKVLFSLLAFLILFGSIAPKFLVAKAQSSSAPSGGKWYDQGYFDWFNKVYDTSNPSEIFGERYTAAQVQWVFYSLVALLVPNKEFVRCAVSGDIGSCLSLINPVTENIPAQPKESLASLVFSPDRPLSFVSYTRNSLAKFSLVPTANAQTIGFGFQAFDVIQKLWSSVRNIVYGLFVLMAIILAFMIMFRVKVAPQVVISVQSAIPKLIIALILVTFSYAIAGFVVDLMYVLIGLISVALASSGQFFASNPLTIFKFLTTGYVGINSTLGVPLGIFGLFGIYASLFSMILFWALLAQNGGVAALITSVLTLGTWDVFLLLLSIIAYIVLSIILIWSFFKVMWMLIKTFAQLIITVIFGPFQIALGVVIPNMGFGPWLKSLVANLAVFPITGLFLAMAFVFINLAASATTDAFKSFRVWDFLGILNPALLSVSNAFSSNGWPPLLSGPRGMLALIYLGVSLVFITLIPKTVEIIQGFITGKPFAFGSAIGEAFGPITGTASFAKGAVTGGVSKYIGEEVASGLRRGFGSGGSGETNANQTIQAGTPPRR